ncbi:unnamed protein product [Brassicogethes aeneus]|uniref:Protein white n=1 Tax=Brassicogethes aeneus TaxID=1431903 RepID=A0A9P0B6H7_BRAAE|nr:unnamed protein product [Brassicogethes aeneus]
MSDEKLPLLQKAKSIEESNDEQSEESTDSLSTAISSFRVPIYGTETALRYSQVPINERITYTWHEINVFTDQSKHRGKKKYICCGPTTQEPVPRKQILTNVSGVAHPGELLAILGSSGSGKTTLLNALNFRSSSSVAVQGTRCVNDVPVASTSLTSRSAYVQQDDLFIGTLTVKEHLVFQALLRMDKHISYERRMHRVDEVISELALTKCRNTRIGTPGRVKGISGGEQKRLSFASEVLTNPALMFCDEPTSGLDSFMALNVVQVLKSMAQSGKTVICTIHQPSSELYAMFDKLLLMAEGRVAFLGTPEQADFFFAELEAPCPNNYNPADYFIQLLAIVPGQESSCRQAIDKICTSFQESDIGVQIELNTAPPSKSTYGDVWFNGESHSPYKASWCSQFRAVLWRSWLNVINEPLLVKVRVLQTIMVSLIIGLIYFGQILNQDGVMNINGVLFIFLTNMTFQNVFAVINVFCSELPIFLRENRNGMYRTDVYFLSKTLAETPIFVFMPMIFTSICYYMIGLNGEISRFFLACAIVTLVANVSTSFGYLISCAASSVSMALSIGPPLIIPFLLFGGFFLNINSIPVYFTWISYLSWFKYGNEALLINQWRNVTDIDCPIGNSTCPRDGHVILEIYNFQEDHFIMNIVNLVLLILGFRLFAYFALLWKSYHYEK